MLERKFPPLNTGPKTGSICSSFRLRGYTAFPGGERYLNLWLVDRGKVLARKSNHGSSKCELNYQRDGRRIQTGITEVYEGNP